MTTTTQDRAMADAALRQIVQMAGAAGTLVNHALDAEIPYPVMTWLGRELDELNRAVCAAQVATGLGGVGTALAELRRAAGAAAIIQLLVEGDW